MILTREAGALIAKHLPPSASTLHLLDLNGALADSLRALRADVEVSVRGSQDAAPLAGDSCYDAVVGYDVALDDDLLRAVLASLRPGGRFAAIDPKGEPSRALVTRLESLGYVRILVEEVLPEGVLMRGEQPHTTEDTLARVQSIAAQDLSASAFKGRFVHLLIRQTPNKPVWALKPDEAISWEAVALADGEADPALLAFSSLPNAVAFMQPAVLAGTIKDVNKVAKFSRAVTQNWRDLRLLINPSLDVLDRHDVAFVPVDPALAESPDE